MVVWIIGTCDIWDMGFLMVPGRIETLRHLGQEFFACLFETWDTWDREFGGIVCGTIEDLRLCDRCDRGFLVGHDL